MLKANVRVHAALRARFHGRPRRRLVPDDEDLPNPESRIMVDGKDIVMQWRRSNMQALSGLDQGHARAFQGLRLSDRAVAAFRQAHAVASVRHGARWATIRRPRRSTLLPVVRSPNLFVVDGSCLPNSAAVNPALSIAAQALRVADHIVTKDLAA
jgi:choline dehydrogenase-like flavoprotein